MKFPSHGKAAWLYNEWRVWWLLYAKKVVRPQNTGVIREFFGEIERVKFP